jgi:hypothetical protein
MSAPTPIPVVKGNPASALPMGSLSARAQKLLAPKSAHYRNTIEPAGSGLARQAMRKAAI